VNCRTFHGDSLCYLLESTVSDLRYVAGSVVTWSALEAESRELRECNAHLFLRDWLMEAEIPIPTAYIFTLYTCLIDVSVCVCVPFCKTRAITWPSLVSVTLHDRVIGTLT
jgi:hypothetical protein